MSFYYNLTMTYHLSAKAILGTVQALAALQAMACADDERAVLAPILCREKTGLLAIMIKHAFVEVVMKLGSLVLDADLDGETPDTDADYPDVAGAMESQLTVELLTPASFSTTRHGIVRRTLEQAVSFNALRLWCMAARSSADCSVASAALADSFASMARDWQNALSSALSVDMVPAIRDAG